MVVSEWLISMSHGDCCLLIRLYWRVPAGYRRFKWLIFWSIKYTTVKRTLHTNTHTQTQSRIEQFSLLWSLLALSFPITRFEVNHNLTRGSCSGRPIYALHPVSQEFPHYCLWNSSNVGLIDGVPFSSSQGRSLSASSFYPSLLQAIYRAVMFLSFCPQVVSQDPQHFRYSETQAACDGCFARQSNDNTAT